jgi:Ca-activated chloride channel family protein
MHTQDEQRPDPRAQAIQRIVADLLGESDAALREQIAADLAADPSLAAERARLQATIGLVRESMAADARPETLSPEAAARLEAAAARAKPVLPGPGSTRRPWHAAPVFRAAAGFAFVLGAFALWQGSQSRLARSGSSGSLTVADAKRQQDTSAAGSAHEAVWADQAPADNRFDKDARAALDQPAPAPAAAAPVVGGQKSEVDRFAAAGPVELDAGLSDQLTTLGYGGGGTAAREAETQLGAPRIKVIDPSTATVPSGSAVSAVARGASEDRFGGRSATPQLPAAAPPRPAELEANAVQTGSDEFFLGRGERKNEAAPADADDRFVLQELKALGYSGYNKEVDPSTSDRVALVTPEERAAYIELLFADCRRRPSEQPRDMFYRWWGDNPFEYARTDALSTFAVDVDTASYTLARRYLVEGILPTKQQIRTEEFVNYFKGDVPAPTEETFAVATELAPSPFNRSGDTWTLRVALRGREVTRQERQPLALTFVVDVSGSMQEQNRLELVKHALRLLVGELDARDSIAVVAFSNEPRLVLPKTSARERGLIESALHPLRPEGGTNVQAGLRMGYEAALAGLDEKAHNRVVLLSDGVGNIGATDAQTLTVEVEHARQRGLWLNTVGVGMGNHNDTFLEQLADKGDGVCNYIDDAREARRALVENFTGAFEPIARDVKIQVEFDPAQVERYRLLGYENRAVADADFRNDAVDAGEIGAGHQVVALYEVVRTGAGDGPLATVRVRWKPAGRELARNQFAQLPAREAAWTVDASRAAGSFAATSAGFRRSVLMGQLAEVLRRSIHARDDSLESLLSEARKLAPELADPDFDEFVAMVERTIELIAKDWGRYDDLARRLDQLRMQNYLKARLEDVARDLDRAQIEELDGQIRALEQEIRFELEKQDPRIRHLGYTDDR